MEEVKLQQKTSMDLPTVSDISSSVSVFEKTAMRASSFAGAAIGSLLSLYPSPQKQKKPLVISLWTLAKQIAAVGLLPVSECLQAPKKPSAKPLYLQKSLFSHKQHPAIATEVPTNTFRNINITANANLCV